MNLYLLVKNGLCPAFKSCQTIISKKKIRSDINQIKKKTVNFKSTDAIEVYVQSLQIELLQFREEKGKYKSCDDRLSFLENFYPNHLDQSLPISDLGKQKLINTLTCLSEIRIKFKSLNTYLEKVLWPLLYPEKQRDFSIHQANYMLYLHKKWVKEFIPSHPNYQEKELLQFLISYNYNTSPFFEYITGQVILLLSYEEDPKMQIQTLTSYMNELERVPICVEKGFSYDFKSIKNMLAKWLSQEVEHSKDKIGLGFSVIPKSSTKEAKLEMNLSIAQIAYIIKLLYKKGIITNSNQIEVINIVRNVVRSKRAQDISFNSFNSKYYNIEDNTKESVLAMFAELKDQIN